jgi:hypothetical protein
MQWPEPFGLVMIEALACGTPVVATPAGAAPEIVDDGVTGYLRRRGKDLVAALHDAASLDRAACRDAARRRFSATRMVDDHVRLYKHVVAASTSAGRPAVSWASFAPERTDVVASPRVALGSSGVAARRGRLS